MGSEFFHTLLGIVSLFALIAIVSVLVSRNALTSQVIQASGSAVGNNIGVAISPVTGERYHIDLSYPGGGGFGAFGETRGFYSN